MSIEDDIDPVGEGIRDLAANVAALAMIMVDKGVCTRKEFDTAHAQAVTVLDQQFAEMNKPDTRTAEEFAKKFCDELMRGL